MTQKKTQGGPAVTLHVECYCPACGAPVACTVVDDAVTTHRSCPCEITPDWLHAIDWAARRKLATAAFFRQLMG